MTKLTKRKGFNFFRSYFDVYNELETIKDKIAFIDALLERQFMGIKPVNLKGMAKFAYISQTNSIDSQVKGYEDKTGNILRPTEGGVVGVKLPPSLQVEEKGEGEVKEKVKVIVKERIINNVKFSNDCKTSEQWKETTAMQNKIKPDAINFFIDNFESHLITMEEQKKTLKEFKEHFSHWLRKQDLSVFKSKVLGKSNQL
jgi:hypothetical protein